MRILLSNFVFYATLTTAVVLAQPPEAFEVATIKPSDPLNPATSFHFDVQGGIKAEGTTLKDLVLFAYDLRDFQLSGVSGWMSSMRHAVVGKGERNGSPATGRGHVPIPVIRKRVQALLNERFQLSYHMESKEMSVYGLVIARGR